MRLFKSTRRVFNSPLIRSANFANESFVNLIQLKDWHGQGKYKSQTKFAVYATTKQPRYLYGFAQLDKALAQFDLLVKEARAVSTLLNLSIIHHDRSYPNNVEIIETSQPARVNVISPDGFSIHPTETYSNNETALAALEVWKKRYEPQGYYSSNNGRIPLADLASYCQIVPVTVI